MKKIEIESFRCFEKYEINFTPKVNVLIGDNASGKTSVIEACKYVLSSFFAGFSDEHTRFLSPSNTDFHIVQTEESVVLPENPIKLHFTLHEPQVYQSLTSDKQDVENLYSKTYILQKNSKKNSRALVSGIKEWRLWTKYLQENLYTVDSERQFPLPVFSYFTTKDIHTRRKINQRQFLKYVHKASFGYYECLEGSGLFRYWISRLLVLKEANQNLEEIEIIKTTLLKALGEEGCDILTDISIRPIKAKVFFILKDGREVPSDLLSDGYRRIIYIIMDIAFRAALLNKEFYGVEAGQRSFGTVLIDELDLHLHPSLQAKIVKALNIAFPNMQFIVTTHAPLLMSTVSTDAENSVLLLNYNAEKGYTVSRVNTYGQDASSILDIVLNQPKRDPKVNRRLDELFDAIDEENYEKALVLLKNLQEEFHDYLPELAQAEAMIHFLKAPIDD